MAIETNSTAGQEVVHKEEVVLAEARQEEATTNQDSSILSRIVSSNQLQTTHLQPKPNQHQLVHLISLFLRLT